MNSGRIEQIGSPLHLYDKPHNVFVAGFIGSPAMNMLTGEIVIDRCPFFVMDNGVRLPIEKAPAASDGRPVTLGVRPEHMEISDEGMETTVVLVEPTGSSTQITAKLATQEVVGVFRERLQVAPGEKLRMRPSPKHIHFFDCESGNRVDC